jgi:hypothetical protein
VPEPTVSDAVGTAISDGVATVTDLIVDNVALLFAVPAILLAYKVGKRLFRKIA